MKCRSMASIAGVAEAAKAAIMKLLWRKHQQSKVWHLALTMVAIETDKLWLK